MKRRVIAAPVVALGVLGFLPVLAGTANASQTPPIRPPGVYTSPPVNESALDHTGTGTACGAIFANNPIATESSPNPPLVGTTAFEHRGEVFCGI